MVLRGINRWILISNSEEAGSRGLTDRKHVAEFLLSADNSIVRLTG